MDVAQSPTPYVDLIPKDPIANLEWRIKVREAALESTEVRDALYQACMEDVLFFVNGFCWLSEPRGVIKEIPFITWPHQDPAFVSIDEAIDEAERTQLPVDVKMPKSRAQGGSYIAISAFQRRWLRDRKFKAGLVTRTEKLVDSATDPDTLMYKVDEMLNALPFWLLPKGYDSKKHRSLSDHTITNPENGSSFCGYAATQDVGRGGRKTVFLTDEIGSKEFISGGKDYAVMESLQDVTNCVIQCSTFGADSGEFFEVCQDESSGVTITLDWKDNPSQNKYAYVLRKNGPEALNPADQEYVDEYYAKNRDVLKRLESKGFAFTEHVRSPWYDARCQRPGATPRLVAKELDMNPRGAVGKVFDVLVP